MTYKDMVTVLDEIIDEIQHDKFVDVAAINHISNAIQLIETAENDRKEE